jgi:hypothetical protein
MRMAAGARQTLANRLITTKQNKHSKRICSEG